MDRLCPRLRAVAIVIAFLVVAAQLAYNGLVLLYQGPLDRIIEVVTNGTSIPNTTALSAKLFPVFVIGVGLASCLLLIFLGIANAYTADIDVAFTQKNIRNLIVKGVIIVCSGIVLVLAETAGVAMYYLACIAKIQLPSLVVFRITVGIAVIVFLVEAVVTLIRFFMCLAKGITERRMHVWARTH